MNFKIPLFPLKKVIFPEEFIPLHIFEDRYKRMIYNSIENKNEFGIIYRDNGKTSKIGCTVSIDKIIKKHDDGKYDILVKGINRFQIVNFFKEEELWYADVEILEEKYNLLDPKLFNKVLDKYLKLLLSINPVYDIQNEINKTKSFDLTKNIIIPSAIKQEFLELKDESERIYFIDNFLDSILDNSLNIEKLNFTNKYLN